MPSFLAAINTGPATRAAGQGGSVLGAGREDRLVGLDPVVIPAGRSSVGKMLVASAVDVDRQQAPARPAAGKRELLRTGGSPNSPRSGNAYPRSLLARIRADGGLAVARSRMGVPAPKYGADFGYSRLAPHRQQDDKLAWLYRSLPKEHDFPTKLRKLTNLNHISPCIT